MEFVNNGDLSTFIQRYNGAHIPEAIVLKILAMVCLGVSHIH